MEFKQQDMQVEICKHMNSSAFTAYALSLKMEAVCPSETSVNFYMVARRCTTDVSYFKLV
jgi:hypothetical protein